MIGPPQHDCRQQTANLFSFDFDTVNLCCIVPDCGYPRFRQLRRKHVRVTAKNPRAKPRHEIINTKLYVESKNENFCDIYQALLGIHAFQIQFV